MQFVTFSISAATGDDCWFSITPKLFSLLPSGCHSSGRFLPSASDTSCSESARIKSRKNASRFDSLITNVECACATLGSCRNYLDRLNDGLQLAEKLNPLS